MTPMDLCNLRTCLLSETWPECSKESNIPLLRAVAAADQALEKGRPDLAAWEMGATDLSLLVWERAVDRLWRAKA